MSRIRSKNTRPELKIKKVLLKLGFSYHPKNIYGNPDFANKKGKIAIFIDGCFWHSCKQHGHNPKSNKTYWDTKLQRNKKRDRQVNLHLKSEGWKILRIWEHEIPK